MSRGELWSKYVARNPSFDGEGMVTLSARGLRKLYEQTWAVAYEAGLMGDDDDADGDDTDGTEAVPPSGVGDDSNLSYLMKMFGMKK